MTPRPIPKRVVIAALVVVAALGIGLLPLGAEGGERAPSVVAASMAKRSEQVVFPAQGRPTIVSFFASWCRQCDAQLRGLHDAHARLGEQVMFVGVNFSDQRALALRHVSEAGVTFPVVSDESGAIAQKFGVLGVPRTVFVDARGAIVKRVNGVDRQLGDDIRRHLGITVPAR
jgi:cytochrome c biogenesis protein CcmG, thiol:disulfide interchange protein DsbE